MQINPLIGQIDGELPQLDWETSFTTVLGNNPALRAARVRADRARIVIRRARKEPIPNIDLSLSLRQNNVSSDDVTSVQLGVPLPLFDKNQGNIRSAHAALMEACNEVKRIELDLQDRLTIAFRRYSNARQQVERYRDRMVPRAERSLELVTNGYEQGQVEYLVLLTAQQTYVQVNLAYLDSLEALRNAAARIDSQMLSGSLGSPVSTTMK